MRIVRKLIAATALCGVLAGCGVSAARVTAEPPTLGTVAESTSDLLNLPEPTNKLYVAVYAFQDLTGQHKPNDTYADYSFAVTQGGAAILINALHDAGEGKWFSVLERNRLGDLLQERQIIRANRQENIGPGGKPLSPIGPLLNAGVLLEGGIVGYDSNVLTGGLGATFLGIGGSAQYRKDDVQVYIRAVSVLTGEVLVADTTEKTVYSVSLDGQTNRYVGYNKLLQIEGGITTNEPVEIAVRQAIEKAVYTVVIEGSQHGYWSFADADAQKRLITQFVAQRDGTVPKPAVAGNPPGPRKSAGGGETGGDHNNATEAHSHA